MRMTRWLARTVRRGTELTTSLSAGALRRLPVSSETLGPPKGFVRAARDWLASGHASAESARLHAITPGAEGMRPPPGTLDGQVPWQFEAFYGGRTIQDPPGWVLEIPEGRVAGNGSVITPDDCLLADVSRECIVGDDQSKHSIRRRIRLGRPVRVSGRVAVLAVSNVNYWHWFFDVLPRILLLERMPGGLGAIDRFVVNELRTRYQLETLERLGVPADRIIQSHERLHIKADRLLVPSVFHEVPARWACRLLRERLVHSPAGSGAAEGKRRIYISRSDARKRRVLNEDEVMNCLSNHGFAKVILDGKTVREQAEIFSSAELVVAPHGAGLTNSLFCSEGTAVVEIFPPTYVNPCYWVLAMHLALPYYCQIGEGPMPPPPPAGMDPDVWLHSFARTDMDNGRDIRVNIDDLQMLLDRASAELARTG
jgi:capsular polysaccharide biosynthesis protein